MDDKAPKKRDIERRFLATVRAMGRRGFDHPLTQPSLVGALIGGMIGYAIFDGAVWLLGAVAGAAATVYLKLDKKI